MTPRTESRFDCLIALAFWFIGAVLVMSNDRLESHACALGFFLMAMLYGRLTKKPLDKQ